MGYEVRNGIVEYDGVPVETEALFRLGKFDVELCGQKSTLFVSKRPSELRFHFNIETEPMFRISVKGADLNEEQLHSLSSKGYFIVDGKRVHFVTSSIFEYVVSALEKQPLSSLIKLLRKLYLEGLTDQIPSDLVESIRVFRKRSFGEQKLFIKKLYPYQKQGVDWLCFCAENQLGTILADDMGLGKTAQIIALCCDVLEKYSGSKILIVVPNPLLDNWVREFAFFAPSIQPYLHYGNDRRGVSSALAEHSVIITPYTTMSSDIAMLEELHFNLAVFDEASMLKNPNSGRSISARRLHAEVSVAMSGTPVENSLMDAWALCDLVFPNFLGTQQEFKSRYVHNNLSHTLEINLDELEAALRQITLRRMKKDVLEQLPEKIDIHLPVSLGESERFEYLSIIDEMREEASVGGVGILPLINKLQQFTSHPALINSKLLTDPKSLKHNSAKFELMMMKLDAICELDEKVIIFATFQKMIDLISGAIREKYGILPGVIDGRTPNAERQPLIDEFSIKEGFGVLILHPKTAGMGLNITAATNVIHYARQWNPALEEQATARAWRNGQQSVVNVYYMFYADTIEETIDERIRLKQKLSDQVVSVADNKETDKQIMLTYLETLDS